MKNTKAHLFIAVPIPDAIKKDIQEWCQQIQKQIPQISFKKWVFSSDYHITVKFLGGVEEDIVGKLQPLMKEAITKQSSFSLTLEELDTFGKTDSPRILWTRVKGNLDPLLTLQKNIDLSMEKIGFISEKRLYKPHLTLAKNYTGEAPFKTQHLEQAAEYLAKPLEWEANEIVLYQTHVRSEPMYEPIETLSFS